MVIIFLKNCNQKGKCSDPADQVVEPNIRRNCRHLRFGKVELSQQLGTMYVLAKDQGVHPRILRDFHAL